MMCCPIDWSAANDEGKITQKKWKTELKSRVSAELSYEHVHCTVVATFDDHGYISEKVAVTAE